MAIHENYEVSIERDVTEENEVSLSVLFLLYLYS